MLHGFYYIKTLGGYQVCEYYCRKEQYKVVLICATESEATEVIQKLQIAA